MRHVYRCVAVKLDQAGSPGFASGSEDVDGSDDVLTTNGTLAHPLPTLGAGDHVTALQQDAVDGGVHADLTQVLLQASRTDPAGLCRRRRSVVT